MQPANNQFVPQTSDQYVPRSIEALQAVFQPEAIKGEPGMQPVSLRKRCFGVAFIALKDIWHCVKCSVTTCIKERKITPEVQAYLSLSFKILALAAVCLCLGLVAPKLVRKTQEKLHLIYETVKTTLTTANRIWNVMHFVHKHSQAVVIGSTIAGVAFYTLYRKYVAPFEFSAPICLRIGFLHFPHGCS